MNKHFPSLRWFLIFVSNITALYFVSELGMLEYLWNNDASKISFGIIAFYLGVTFLIGKETSKICTYREKFFDQKIDVFNFCGSLCTSLGLLGSVVGFCLLSSSNLVSIDPQDFQQVQLLIKNMATGIGTAFLTTLVGLVCSILTRIQVLNLSYAKETRSIQPNSTD